MDSLKDFINEKLEKAKEELEENRVDAPNSYAHGFEVGVVVTCQDILEFIEEGE